MSNISLKTFDRRMRRKHTQLRETNISTVCIHIPETVRQELPTHRRRVLKNKQKKPDRFTMGFS